ncbi:MAG: hypothetical protein R2877_02785 [Bdellovibrionota bacterium]
MLGLKKPFLAFWSTKETRSTNFKYEGSTVVFTGNDSKHWYPHSNQDHFVNKGKPRGFNPQRIQNPLSNITIIQNPITKEYAVLMQLGFKRSIPARLLMAYINRDMVTGYLIRGRDFVLNEIEKGFAAGPGRTGNAYLWRIYIRSESKGEQYVNLQSPNQLSSAGYISPTDNYIPWSIGHITFPGESNVLNLPIQLNKNIQANNVLAKK